MLGLHHRLAIAGVVIATAVAVPAAALASGSGSPSGKPVPPQASAASASKSAAARSQTVPAAVTAFATRLGVSASAAGRALKHIAALSSKNGADLAIPAFAAIAHDLGVSPAQLAAAWDAVRQSVVGK
jgi:hypothetical protein